jgi:hypothetical protein
MTPRSESTFQRFGDSPLNATHVLPEVIHAVYSIKQLQNEKRSLIQHSEPGLPRVWRKNGRSRQRVQVPGEMPEGLASVLGWRPPNRTVVKWPAKQLCSVTLRSFLAIDRTIGTRRREFCCLPFFPTLQQARDVVPRGSGRLPDEVRQLDERSSLCTSIYPHLKHLPMALGLHSWD